MLLVFGGRIRDLKSFLIEERLPEGWESGVRSRWGLTFAKFNFTTVLPLEFSTSEKKYRAKQAALQQSETSSSQDALNAPQPWNVLLVLPSPVSHLIANRHFGHATLRHTWGSILILFCLKIFISFLTFTTFLATLYIYVFGYSMEWKDYFLLDMNQFERQEFKSPISVTKTWAFRSNDLQVWFFKLMSRKKHVTSKLF